MTLTLFEARPDVLEHAADILDGYCNGKTAAFRAELAKLAEAMREEARKGIEPEPRRDVDRRVVAPDEWPIEPQGYDPINDDSLRASLARVALDAIDKHKPAIGVGDRVRVEATVRNLCGCTGTVEEIGPPDFHEEHLRGWVNVRLPGVIPETWWLHPDDLTVLPLAESRSST